MAERRHAAGRDVIKVLQPLCWETDLMCSSRLSSLSLSTLGGISVRAFGMKMKNLNPMLTFSRKTVSMNQ